MIKMNIEQTRRFFTERFNRTPESDPRYFEEWEVRLMSYNPLKYMDSETKAVYRRVFNVEA